VSELILTDEEKASATFLEWDDASIGRAVKKFALTIKDAKGGDSIKSTAGALTLVTLASDAGAETTTIKLEGVTDGENPIGDWLITVKRIEK
jgi:hypothetical protein